MNTKTDDAAPSDKSDLYKWLAVTGLVGIGIVGFYYFAGHSVLIRVLVLLALMVGATFIALKTEKGRFALDFLREAHMEVRKVVWPTTDETLKMTGIVILMVIVVAIIIWILDSILFWIVRLLTGQGG